MRFMQKSMKWPDLAKMARDAANKVKNAASKVANAAKNLSEKAKKLTADAAWKVFWAAASPIVCGLLKLLPDFGTKAFL